MLRALAVAGLLTSPGGARAQPPSPRPRQDLTADAAVTAGAGAATLSLLLLEDQLAPARCRWCSPSGLEADVSLSLRWRDTELAARSSDALAFTLGGAVLAYSVYEGYARGDARRGWSNALLVTEATSVAMLLDTTAKYAFARQRPYAWRGETRPGDRYDRNLSFVSAHTTFAFALAASSSTLLLEQRSPYARTYACAAFGVAATTAYLRVAADRHFASDVLVGAAVGTLVGWAIPHFFHAPTEDGLRLAPAPGGIAVAW